MQTVVCLALGKLHQHRLLDVGQPLLHIRGFVEIRIHRCKTQPWPRRRTQAGQKASRHNVSSFRGLSIIETLITFAAVMRSLTLKAPKIRHLVVANVAPKVFPSTALLLESGKNLTEVLKIGRHCLSPREKYCRH